MKQITEAQRRKLEAAGYTVSKSGRSVKNKDGGTVGGFNENGNIYGGSKKVMDILRDTSEATPAAKPAARASGKSKATAKAPAVAKDPMKGYRAGDITMTSLDKKYSGRGDGRTEATVRRTSAAIDKADATPRMSRTEKSQPIAQLPPRAGTPPSKSKYTFAEWKAMTPAERKRKGLPQSEVGAQWQKFVGGKVTK